MTENVSMTLPQGYVPADFEPEVRDRWRMSGVFHAEPVASDVSTFSVVVPPPNVTAALHLGHALNTTLQDVLVRYHRMRGDATLWLPGTDHAGIATQTVVEKRLLNEGITRHELGREAFVAKVQEWKDEYEQVILDQFQAMGASCDVQRVRFTMDDVCATAVQHAFFVLFRDGLVYRGKRLVNWDPVTLTALADDEVEMREVEGHMWYLRYPLADGSGHVTVATTRPETMLGDTAVAVNPADPRAAALVGRTIRLPIIDREIPIIADDFVVQHDPDSSDAKARFASGFLKVTPAHDPNDWEIGRRHDLAVVNVLAPDATISDAFGWSDVTSEARPFLGLSREAARTAVVRWFADHGLLEEVRPYTHVVGHSYRSHVPIEPRLSDQWYVKVTDDRLRGAALRALAPEQSPPLPDDVEDRRLGTSDGDLRFTPQRYARTYHQWHERLRDWCVSRQLWWGHQIPVWTRQIGLDEAPPEVHDAKVDVMVPVTSRWTDVGIAHAARKVTDDLVEEAVCVPPDATLRRVSRLDASLDAAGVVAALERDGFVRDHDVLDTWVSSALWPLATMGWPWPDDHPEMVGLLESFNPTSVLVTAREIITLWVSRMVMFNRYFLDGGIPFRDVFIHAMIQDRFGQKMSKSLGNGVDPRDIIGTHGTDALRFTLVNATTDHQDVRMPVDLIDPHSGVVFTPEFIQTPSGQRVAAPIQRSPKYPDKTMVTAYGVAAGLVQPTDDMPLAVNTSTEFDRGRNIANKLWNVTRFVLSCLGDVAALASTPVEVATRPAPDRWILDRFARAVVQLETHLDRYEFKAYAETLVAFMWNDLCDRYVEMVKPTVREDLEQQVVLTTVLDGVLRLMHPVMPFVTETLWPTVTATRRREVVGVDLPPAELLASAAWPRVDGALVDESVTSDVQRALALVEDIRSFRTGRGVPMRQKITLHAPEPVLQLVAAADGVVQTLAGVGDVVDLAAGRPDVAWPMIFEGHEVLLGNVMAEVDVTVELARLQRQIDEKVAYVTGLRNRLSNDGFLAKAPVHVIEQTRRDLEAAEAELAALTAALQQLG